MKKSISISMSAALAISALTPVAALAVENTSDSENAMTGFYDVKSGNVVAFKDFVKLSPQEKKNLFRQQSNYFADGAGNAIKAIEIAMYSDSELDNNMKLQTEVEVKYNVLLTADGKVIFLSKEEVATALEDAITNAKKELDKVTGEQKQKLEDAIKAAEEALTNQNATAEELQAALDKLDQAINSATSGSASAALEDAIADAKKELDKVTEEQRKALEEAIKAAEEALAKADATSQEIQDALDKLQEAVKNNTTEDPAVTAAKDAIAKAEKSGKQEDIDAAQSLIDQLENGTVKEELQNSLNKIPSGSIDLSGFDTLIKEVEQLLADVSGQHTEESIQALELALQKAKIVMTQNKGKEATEEVTKLINRETAELQSALDNLVRKDELVFKPTKETQKTAPLFLDPVVTTPSDLQKNSGGVLGLDIGILEAGLLSASQISSINDSNKHHVEVAEGTTLDLTASVAIHTLVGGHAFNIFVAKENENGDFATIATHRASSGGALFITVPTEVDLGTLDSGTYEIILGVEEGLSLIQVIPYKLIKQTVKDYTQVSTEKSIVAGNILTGQNHGDDGNLLVTSIKEKASAASTSTGLNAVELEGKYGTLSIDRNGNYRYTPASVSSHAGKVEEFNFTMKDIEDGRTAEGTLSISLESVSSN